MSPRQPRRARIADRGSRGAARPESERLITQDDRRIENALTAIHSRLGAIEGKVTLGVRADQDQYLNALKEIIDEQPLIGQIYLLLDGERSQRDVHQELQAAGIKVGEMTVHRRMNKIEEHGLADLSDTAEGAESVLRPAMESVLSLTKNIAKWLQEEGEIVPLELTRRRDRRK